MDSEWVISQSKSIIVKKNEYFNHTFLLWFKTSVNFYFTKYF